MALHIVRNDIVKMKVDAVVNAANTSLQIGGGVCGAIFRAAGEDALRIECEKIGGCEAGKAVITRGFNLPAKHIIHTVGPIWRGGLAGEAVILRSCYKSSLELAKKYKFDSVAFPMIASGTYGYPKDMAVDIAIDELGSFAMTDDMDIYLVVYNSEDFMLETHFRNSIKDYIDGNRGKPLGGIPNITYDKIQETGEVATIEQHFYRRANIEKKEYSRIKQNALHRGKMEKDELISVCLALELEMSFMLGVLKTFGYEMNVDDERDLILLYFFENRHYNIFKVNKALVGFGQKEL